MMNRFSILCGILALTSFLMSGCSGGGAPVVPSAETEPLITGQKSISVCTSNTYMLGYYDIYFDIESGTFEAVFNRDVCFTLNIVPFLNMMTIPQNGITFDSIVIHNDDPTVLGVDVEFSISHPFPGLDQYNAYDLRGVIIGNGNKIDPYTGCPISEYGIDLKMKNADGFTRWFNPTDFTTDKIFGYCPGGYQNLAGDSQLNPYKYYSKHLGKDDNLWSYLTGDNNWDGIFESGSGRTMEIEFPMPPEGLGVMFGYAVVVAWEDQGPDGPFYPYHIPEAVAASVTQTPDVWYNPVDGSGGSLILDIDLFGWEHQPSTIIVESSVLDDYEVFDAGMIGLTVSDHVSTYHVEIDAGEINSIENHEYFIVAEYEGFDYSNDLPDIPHAEGPLVAFFRYDAEVLDESPYVEPTIVVTAPDGGETLVAGEEFDITWTAPVDVIDVRIEYSKDGFSSDINTITASTPNTGTFTWDVPDDPTTTARVRISEVGLPENFDISNSYFTIEHPTITLDVPNGGETCYVGSNKDIEWTASPVITDVKLEYSKDVFGSDIIEITPSTPNTGVYDWEIPDDPSETVRVRISEVGNESNNDESDGDFTIQGPCTPVFTEKWTYDFPGIERMNGSPTIADLDDDGTLEILAFTHNVHKLYCFDHNGNQEWTPFTCPSQVASWYGAPAVGEFNGDGVLDIVVSNTNQSSPNGNRVYVVNGATGAEIFNIPGPFRFECMPSLADVVGATIDDGPDGQLDIFVGRSDVWGSDDCWTACYNGLDGSLVWETQRDYYNLATPALADFDDDGGIDCISTGGYAGQAPNYRGPHALKGEGNPSGDRLIWEANFGDNIWGPPSLYDYTDDGIPDLIIGDHTSSPSTDRLRCVDGSDGSTIWEYQIDINFCNPALGDLNDDGYPDIICFPSYDHIYAFNGDPNATTRVLWDWQDAPGSPNLDTRGSPTLYDVTCDGVPDAIVCMVYNETPTQGIVWIIDGASGNDVAHLDIMGDRIGWGAPCIGDIDNDGITDMVFGSYNNGVLYVYDLGTPVPSDFDARPWPQYMGNIRNTSLYGEEY